MSYTFAALLGVVGAVLVDTTVLRTRLVIRRIFWATYPIILGAQLLSNGILTGRRIVRYDADSIIGWRIGYAPIEDLLFGFALVLLSLSTWVWLGRRRSRRGARPGAGSHSSRTAVRSAERAGRPDRAVHRLAGLPRRGATRKLSP